MNRLRPDRAEGLALLLVVAFAFTLIVYPPMVGLADNGDFFRLMHWGKFEYLPQAAEDRYVGWINREFQITKNPFLSWKGYPSSEAIFVKASSILAILWPGSHRFDLRLLGLIHTIGFGAGCWLLLRGWRVGARLNPLVLFAGLIFVFCDIGYLVYFHSFYGEPASLIFLFALIGTGLLMTFDDLPPRWLVLLFFSAAMLFVVAKPQNLVFTLPLALFATRLAESHRRIALGAIALMVLICAGIYLAIPSAMKDANLYNSTFNGLLKWASAPDTALRQLGLDERLATLSGSNYFMRDLPIDTRSEEFRAAFYSRMSPFKVAGYYIRHPAALGRAMSTSAENAYTLQPSPFGNFEKSAGYPFREKATRWTTWSGIKQRHAPRSLWFTTGYLLLLGVSIGAAWWKQKGHIRRLSEFYALLWLMMIISFVTPVLGDGESDIEKHLFLYNVFFDLSLLLLAGHLLRAACSRLDAHRRS